jgi:putative hydrolase of the HAD superfamily
VVAFQVNVVFDLGGVVVAWKPDDIIAKAIADPETRPIARKYIMEHPDWLELDRGTITVDDAVERAADSGLTGPLVRSLIESVPPALVANDETVALIRRLKAAGNSLYCLSNMPIGAIEYLERRYDFWDLFDGAVISSRVHHCKPEAAIYEHLLETYNLAPRETVFIDDLEVNLAAASRFGMATIQFTDVYQTELMLVKMGCL